MQLSTRAAAVRAAIERATQETATVTEPSPGMVRITARADIGDPERWAQTRRAIQAGDRWGSSDGTGEIVVWSELRETR
ncbi:hypothetical protein ABZV67_40980 [Streptomyces sp. NPDC005065]|uniref:hypothetical protein n=1 Tax=Streptomyces sp. NPDC005065 TaxID=3154461 RepID=UPI00339FCA19